MTVRTRREALGLALCFGLLLPVPASAEEAPAPASTWYVQQITTGDAPVRVEYSWSKGPKLRAEMTLAGRPILTIVAGKTYYVIDRLAGSGVAIARSRAAIEADAKGARPFGNEGARLIARGAEQVGSDKVGSRRCDVYRLTDRRGRREACLTEDHRRLPLQTSGFDRATGRSSTTRYIDWVEGFVAPDAFFEPDPRIQLEHVGYDEYLKRIAKDTVGPAPVLYRELLHGPER